MIFLLHVIVNKKNFDMLCVRLTRKFLTPTPRTTGQWTV